MGPSKKPPRQPSIIFEDFSEADRVFRESLDAPQFAAVLPEPEPESSGDKPTAKKGERAQKRRRDEAPVIDLHGLTLQQAIEHLDDRLARLLAGGPGALAVKIVTGKGLHSGPGGSVLAKEIHRHVRDVYAKMIVSIEDSPADTVIRGLPLRGHFSVRLRRG